MHHCETMNKINKVNGQLRVHEITLSLIDQIFPTNIPWVISPVQFWKSLTEEGILRTI